MSLISRTYCLLLFLVLSLSAAGAQPYAYTELGAASGSGIVMLPTTTVSPKAQFRLTLDRIEFLKDGYRGLNLYQGTIGFSPNLEAYLKFSSEENNTSYSISSFGVGGKFLLPFTLPVLRQVALWGESMHSDDRTSVGLFPQNFNRAAIIGAFGKNEMKAILLYGRTGNGNLANPLYGAGVTMSLGHVSRIGAEYYYGYTTSNSWQAAVDYSYRIISNISVQVSPGYLKSPTVSFWTISAGISFSTADIDFNPVIQKKKEEFKLPSIEEIEKETKEEKK